MKWNSAKSCIKFKYIFFTKVRYIRQNKFDIHLTRFPLLSKYIFSGQKVLYVAYIFHLHVKGQETRREKKGHDEKFRENIEKNDC